MPGETSGRLPSRVLVGLLLAELACGSAEPGPSRPLEIGRRAQAASTSSLITYHGGRVLSGAEIVLVFWGNDFDAGEVDRISGNYRTLTEVNDFDWISEYDTPSQHIRRPSLAGEVVIDPGDARTTLIDTQIVAELVRQLDAGVLPAATEDSYYAVYFPPGITIELGEFLEKSCTTWAAYHDDLAPASPGTYAAFPACGHAPAVAAHELFEAVTDPQPGDGWLTEAGEEIADLCVGSVESLQLRDGGSLVVQRLWSDVAAACSGSGNEFFVSIDPTEASVGPVLTFSVSMIPPRYPYAQLSWQVSGLPDGGASASLVPGNAPRRWTLTVDLPHPDVAFTLGVEAQTESWTASASTRVLTPAAPSAGGTGCSQAGGNAGPERVAAAVLLASLCLRRRA
jgi:hypothetical protein